MNEKLTLQVMQFADSVLSHHYGHRLVVNKPLGIMNDQFWELFKASIESNGLLDNRGPAGCGKSESFVDIMWFCGVSSAVINCSD